MDQIVPPHFKPQYSRDAIRKAVERVGREVGVWAEKVWNVSHTDILAVPILRGGMFFFTDLVREIGYSVEVAPVRTWVYESTQNAVQRQEARANLEGVPARGRAVLLVDDICDSGKTLKLLHQSFKDLGAAEVKSAVLIKRETGEETFSPDWVGFDYKGPEWFVGYGMEDCERWRNLPGIYIINQNSNND